MFHPFWNSAFYRVAQGVCRICLDWLSVVLSSLKTLSPTAFQFEI